MRREARHSGHGPVRSGQQFEQKLRPQNGQLPLAGAPHRAHGIRSIAAHLERLGGGRSPPDLIPSTNPWAKSARVT